ncbi:MAG: mCpol domain-containing protein [Caldilineaceae bacterium]|nr:mCpol domain-containing protein [Caldilineaceae bacterium]
MTEAEAFKAELSLLLSLPFVRYYTQIVHPVLNPDTSPPKGVIRSLSLPEEPPAEELYFGLDGDDTGKLFEDLFLVGEDERQLHRASQVVSSAIQQIAAKVRQHAGKQAVIFQAGDDILFRGRFSQQDLQELHDLYTVTTQGMSCCIGYGRTLREAFLALKLAKTSPGKNSIVGIELLDKGKEPGSAAAS